MNLLIKGLSMPDEGCHHTICVYSDGKVETGEPNSYQAIPLPSHGRLIDADALGKVMCEGIAPSVKDGGFKHPFDIIRAVANAPTIIPAEEGE